MNPWRADPAPQDVAYGPAPTPTGAPYQQAPVGQQPGSVGDPDLLPRYDKLAATELVALPTATAWLLDGPVNSDRYASRSKLVDSVRAAYAGSGSILVAPGSCIVQLVSMPIGLELVQAINAGKADTMGNAYNDLCTADVQIRFMPPLFIPPQQAVHPLFIIPFMPTAANRKNVSGIMQWRLL